MTAEPARPHRLATALLPLLLLAPPALHAQVVDEPERRLPAVADVGEEPPRTRGAAAFAVEAAGATAGSLAGTFGALAVTDCDDDDLDCILSGVAVTGSLSALGAAGGDLLAGRLADTEPSIPGAVGGVVVGTLGGLAVVKGLEAGGVDGAGAVVGYSLTQGLLTALGSRLFRRWDL